MDNIDNILNRYFEGATSLQEEKLLKTYFSGEDVSPRHAPYRIFFVNLGREKEIKAPPFRMPAHRNGKTAPLRRSLWFIAASVAAVLAFVWVMIPDKRSQQAQQDYVVFVKGQEISNPETAKKYARRMFAEADAIIRTSYEPFIEAKTMQGELDADKLFETVFQQINYIESGNK